MPQLELVALVVREYDAAIDFFTRLLRFVSPPRTEPYGQVAVFLDIEGNRWDLLGPAA